MVRDEADIIGSTVAHMLGQVDHVIVADNGSSDETRAILHDLGVEVLDDLERGYFQSAKMSRLADYARRQGATWVVPFDADELWWSPFGRLADVLAKAGVVEAVRADVFDYVATALDPLEVDPVRRIRYRRRAPLELPKVAARAVEGLVVEQGNHGATVDGRALEPMAGLVQVRHYPYRSAAQFVRKARNGAEAYKAAGDALRADYGAHWRQWGELLDAQGDEAVADIFRQWYWSADPAGDGLEYDPA